VAIDTLGFSKYLEEHGVARGQAEAQAEAANLFLFPQLATTAELDGVRRELKSDIGQLKSDLAGTETSLRADIAKLEATLTMRTIAIVGALNAALFALLKLA